MTPPALALAGAALAAPAAHAAPAATDPPSPDRTALRIPVGAHVTVAAQMRAQRHANLRADLVRRALRLARRRDVPAAAERRRLRGMAPEDLRDRIVALRRERSSEPTVSPVLEAIAACESGGNPATDTGNGFYGKYQFTLQTWASVGGTGNPAAAPEAEQDRRAAILYARQGAAPWPVCGR